jgi:hypothetical protein
MAHLIIEMDRGCGRELPAEGPFAGTTEQIMASLPPYAISNPHRALRDGVLIAAALPGGVTLFLDETFEVPTLIGTGTHKVCWTRLRPSAMRSPVNAAPRSSFGRAHQLPHSAEIQR